ncbi:MAG: hypothetical protein GY699_13870 [Desulfobacteraceae bacterium]|nr:hypothetical protein [Desulfobacteraceae bacterium]
MITGIHISSSEMVINKDDGKKKPLPKLINNQIVSAKVLKLLPQGKAQLLVNNQKVVAKTALLLTPGEEVQLKVVEQKNAIILKLIGPVQKMSTSQISSLVSLFSKSESAPDITSTKIANVKDLLYDMALKSDKPDKSFLPKLIEKSGLAWEKKVATTLLDKSSATDIKNNLDVLLKQDVKGNILREMFSLDPQKFETVKMATSFLETIENFQLLNHQSSESGRYLLPFPIFSESAFSFGQLLIDTGDKTKSDTKNADKLIHLSFLLNMTRLGPLRADFSILKKDIAGGFLLRDNETCKYVKSMIPELKNGLVKLGYHVHQIECNIAKKEEIQETAFIETLVKSQDDQMLNIVI